MATIKIAGSSAKSKTKAKKPKITSVTIRENRGKDFSPTWEDHETWDASQFLRNFHAAMQFYNIELSAKDYKPGIMKWMNLAGYDKSEIDQFKTVKDWQCNSTSGGVALCLLKGMPSSREDFNEGRSMEQWLRTRISDILLAQEVVVEQVDAIAKVVLPAITIQDRVYEASLPMCDEIEDAIEIWQVDPDAFDPKQFKVVNLLKGREAKSAHARIIKDYYNKTLAELEELNSTDVDEQLKEAYNHRTKKQIRSMVAFLTEVAAACDMIMQEAKATRKIRIKKAVPKDKIVAKLQYLKIYEPLKLVSVNPTTIIGAKELWCFDIKTKKLFKYVAADFTELGISGTSITGFNEGLSVGKTLRRPADQLTEFKKAGKVALRTFLDTIKTIDIKASGRINQNQILLKIA